MPLSPLHRYPKPFLVLVFFISFFSTQTFAKKTSIDTIKISRVGEYKGYATAKYKGFKYHSTYLKMADSTQLATDYYLPKGLEKGTKVPTIIYLTRYVRSLKVKFPASLLKDPVLTLPSEKEVQYFTSYGYAVVIVDVRGTGASTGKRGMEFSPAEVQDGAKVVDWIIAQPWSSGKVGVTGVSYLGTTAELLLVNQHPAVKACIPRSNIFDLYGHIMLPGGIRQGPFVSTWGNTTNALDRNDFSPFGKKAKLVKGAHPVQGDKHNQLYNQAIADHKYNFDVYKGLEGVEYRDDKHPDLPSSSSDYSIHFNYKKIAASGTPIYRIGGWYDASLQQSVVEGFQNTPNTVKALVGPWDHGPANTVSPWAKSNAVNFDVKGEMLRFFDHYLKNIDNGIDREKPFYYYSIGVEHWDSSTVWPPAKAKEQSFVLNADNVLSTIYGSKGQGTITYKVDTTCGNDSCSRWNSLTPLYKHGITHYVDRAGVDKKMISFTSSPISKDATITGHAVVDLYVAADATDAEVFCYLEDVSPDGKVTYVTEGLFRASNRKIETPTTNGYKITGPVHSYDRKDAQALIPGQTVELNFSLLPISYQFAKGHSIRLSIAGADKAHFDFLPQMPTEFKISCTTAQSSKLILPIME